MLPLSPRLNLEQLRKQAKDLLIACRAGDPDALSRLARHLPGMRGSGPTKRPDSTAVLLAHTQFVIAREQGFPSWPKLQAAGAALAQRAEDALDRATQVTLPVGKEARAEFARGRAMAAGTLARRRDADRLSSCLTSMALRDLLVVRDLLWESGNFGLTVDTLIRGLEHPRSAVRYQCAEALDHFGDVRCFEPLRRLVGDPVPRVRRMALHSLGCDACKLMPLPRDCDVLALIIDRAFNDQSISVRRHAVSELARHRDDPRAVAALSRLADTESDCPIRRDVGRALRRHKQSAIGEIRPAALNSGLWGEPGLGQGRLEQFDRIPGRILDQNLFTADAGDDLVAKMDAFLA